MKKYVSQCLVEGIERPDYWLDELNELILASKMDASQKSEAKRYIKRIREGLPEQYA